MNRKTLMRPEDDVRETPHELFAARNALFNFELDVCATPQNAKCCYFYAPDGYHCPDGHVPGVDGLAGPWAGRVWCNPPFSALWTWVEKAWLEYDAGRVEIIDLLCPATRTEQVGWQRLVEARRDRGGPLETRFLPGRQHFLKDGKPILNPKTGTRSSPKFGCCMLTWRRR